MIHNSKWDLCPLHAFATMILMRGVPLMNTDNIFPQITKGQASKHVNKILKKIWDYNSIQIGIEIPSSSESGSSPSESVSLRNSSYPMRRPLTSHHIRHSGVDVLTETSAVSFASACMRTGLQLSSVNNIFTYLTNAWLNDSPCARHMSDWPDKSRGGVCPGNLTILYCF